MKNDKILELLSRLVDDDTTASESAQATALIEDDIEAAGTVNAFRDQRRTLRSLAEADTPPAILDDLVVEMRREGRPASRGVLVPLLAAAALLVIGFAAMLEVKRHHLDDETLSTAIVTPAPIFALSALPEATETSALGPLEQLLSEPYPPPSMLEAAPLIVLGPLPEPPPR